MVNGHVVNMQSWRNFLKLGGTAHFSVLAFFAGTFLFTKKIGGTMDGFITGLTMAWHFISTDR
jgi:hypothetical protein